MSGDVEELYATGEDEEEEDQEEYALRFFTQNINYYVRPDLAAPRTRTSAGRSANNTPPPRAANGVAVAAAARARRHGARVPMSDRAISTTSSSTTSLSSSSSSSSYTSTAAGVADAAERDGGTATLTSTAVVSSPETRHTTQPANSAHAAATHQTGGRAATQGTRLAAAVEEGVTQEEEEEAEQQQQQAASVYERDAASQVPLLMNEMDAELLQIIAAYYSNKLQRAARGDTAAAPRIAQKAANTHPASPAHMTSDGAPVTRVAARPSPYMAQDKLAAEAVHRLAREQATSFLRPRHPTPLALPGANDITTTAAAAAATTRAAAFASPELPPRPATASSHTQPQAWMSHTLARLPSYSSTSFVRAYVSDINLSFEPALIVSGLAAAVNMIVVHFLQNHVLDTHDHLGLFLIGSYLIFASYYMVYYFLERFSSSFCRIASQDKKFYIIGNLLKAGILVSITPFAFYHLVLIIVYDKWESNTLRNLGCIYAIPDFIAVIVVKRMRWSTWVHHLCVVAFNYFSIMNNYENENVCRCLVVYAAFSSFAYCVNVLLASRFLGVSPAAAHVLSFVALVVYALCCITNWSWQVYYLRRLLLNGHGHWTVYAYMVLISLVMWDDVILNKWLLHQARSAAFAAAKKQRQGEHQPRQHGSPVCLT